MNTQNIQLTAHSAAVGPLHHWLQALRVAAAPAGLLHIGAGLHNPNASDPLHAIYEHASRVVAVEADVQRATQLHTLYSGLPHVQVQQAVVAPSAGPATLVQSSVADESGLCPPESLRAIWPRLKALRTEQVDATSIAEAWSALLSDLGTKPDRTVEAAPNWLFVDCLPSAELLQATPEFLEAADVVVARAIQPEMVVDSDAAVPLQLSVAHLQAVLAMHGLQLLGVQEENHPALVLAVFARDRRQRLAPAEKLVAERDALQRELAQTKTELGRVAEERKARVDEIARVRQELAQLASERQQRIEQLTKARDDQVQLVGQRQQQIEQLIKARDEQAQLALQRQQQIELVAKARDEQVQLATQRQQQIEQLAKLRADLEQQLAASKSQLEQQISSHKLQLEQRAKQEEALTQELREARQTAALSIRLQSLREADLQDLQARYQSSTAAQERQHQLLTKLSERLNVASTYFHQLAAAKPQPAAATIDNRGAKAKLKRQRQPDQELPVVSGKAKKGARP